jgi:hypothetical protein
MKTTSLLVEYLVAGALGFLGLLILVYGLEGKEIFHSIALINIYKINNNWINIISGLMIAFCYGMGIIFESACRNGLEWMHKGIKKARYSNFSKDHESKINGLPENLKNELIKKGYKVYTSLLRYYILRENKLLYEEVEAQHMRMRLTRVMLFLSAMLFISLSMRMYDELRETLMIISRMGIPLAVLILLSNFILIIQIFKLGHSKGCGNIKKICNIIFVSELLLYSIVSCCLYITHLAGIPLIALIWTGSVIVLLINFYAVIYRFDRYCYTIERAFSIL